MKLAKQNYSNLGKQFWEISHFSNHLCTNLGPDHLEWIILKITGRKINNLFCHLQSIIPEKKMIFCLYSGIIHYL